MRLHKTFLGWSNGPLGYHLEAISADCLLWSLFHDDYFTSWGLFHMPHQRLLQGSTVTKAERQNSNLSLPAPGSTYWVSPLLPSAHVWTHLLSPGLALWRSAWQGLVSVLSTPACPWHVHASENTPGVMLLEAAYRAFVVMYTSENQAWFVIPVLRKHRQGNHNSKGILSYIKSPRPAWDTWNPL